VDKHDLQAQFDAKVRQELRSIEPPAGLRERILRGAPPEASGRKVVPFPLRAVLAAAAALLLLGALAFNFLPASGEDRTFAGFQNRMASFAVRQYSMDIFTNDLAAVRAYMKQKDAPADFDLPAALASTPVKGGARLSWQGQPVSMVCFQGPADKTLYLFIIDSASVVEPPSELQLNAVKGLSSAAWHTSGKTYLLAADLPDPQLKSYL
jgi:hypothetical protein